MFAYGTAILTVLEWDRDATISLLLLPIVCATLSNRVALLCWQQGRMKWPENFIDRFAFLVDIFLTAGYVLAWLLSSRGYISEVERERFVLVFLLCTNASTLVSFVPLVREALVNPGHEHPTPWAIWSTAYATLGIVTILEFGFMTELLIYPVMNAVLHGSVAILARQKPVRGNPSLT
ncbi:MAG: hypothetical protein WAV21_03645 [Minisyncoccia bacterium]